MKNALAVTEASRLAELEQTIERGQQTFVEVGRALLEIRDSRLYRESHPTFEDYCRERWGMGRNYANKQIQAAEIAGSLERVGTGVPINEAQTRALAPLKDNPDQMAEAWEEANHGGQPTAAQVREAVARRREPGKKRRASYDVTSTKGRQVAARAKERIERAVGNCSALARAADDFRVEEAVAVAAPEEIDGWLEVFAEARTAITRLRNRIEEAR